MDGGLMAISNELIATGTQVRATARDALAKGDTFEKLVQGMLPDDEFALMNASPRRFDDEGRTMEEAKDPDFRYLHHRSEQVLWVICRYRKDTYYDKVQWSTPAQLNRYRNFQRDVEPEALYIIIGLGGTPNRPDHIFCIPLHEVLCPVLPLSKLKEFEHHDRYRPFKYSFGQLR